MEVVEHELIGKNNGRWLSEMEDIDKNKLEN